MRQKVREIACPDCLRKRLRVFRVEKAGLRTYFVTDPLQNQTYEFEPWQFFVLEILTECESFSRLSLAVEDRYGQPITQEDVDRLFALIAEKKMFGVSVQTTPLLADFRQRRPRPPKGIAQEPPPLDFSPAGHASAGGLSTEVPQSPKGHAGTESASDPKPNSAAEAGGTPLPSSVRRVLDLDRHTSTKGSELFDPTSLLQVLHPLLAPLRHAIYLIPLLLVPALIIAFRYHDQFADDMLHWFGRISIVWHAVIGLLTVNLLATLTSALVAYNYGVTVSAFCIVFYFVVWPRFMVRVGSVAQLPRRERVWYYGAPLLLRLAIFSVTMLVWFNTRHMEGFPARFSLTLAFITQFSFLLAVIPLRESNGYRLLTILVDAPKLREKATNAFLNRIRGRTNKSLDDKLLVVYASACTLFMIAVIGVFLFLVGQFLESHLSVGVGVLTLAVVAMVLWSRMASKVMKVNLAHARATKFTTWRDRETRKVD